MFALDLVAMLTRPAAAGAVTAVLGPSVRAGTRGRAATRPDRLRVVLLVTPCTAALALLAGGPIVALVAGLAGPLAAAIALRARIGRWKAAMRRGAGPAARAISDAAAAGLPGVAAIERAAGDGALPECVAVELRDLATRCRLGLSLDDGLEELRSRASCASWDALVAAIRVQREVGGDLGAILAALAQGLESAARAADEARSLSSQARLTARIVIGLPLVGLALVEVASPGSLSRMIDSPLPRGLLLVALALQVVAAVIVRRVASLGEEPS